MAHDLTTEEGFERAIAEKMTGNPSQEESTPSAEVTPEVVEPSTTEKELVFGKFKTVEEAAESFHNLEQLYGRQTQELGELRKQAGGNRQLQVSEEMIANNPQAVAQWAIENQDPLLYEQAMDYWYGDDPKNAGRFETLQYIAEERKYWEERTKGLAESSEEAAIGSALGQLSTKHSDLSDRTAEMLEIAKERPWLAARLKEGSKEEKLQTLEDLYMISKGRGTPATVVAAEKAPVNKPYVETVGSTIESKGPRTAKDILREQLLEGERSPLEIGIQRES